MDFTLGKPPKIAPGTTSTLTITTTPQEVTIPNTSAGEKPKHVLVGHAFASVGGTSVIMEVRMAAGVEGLWLGGNEGPFLLNVEGLSSLWISGKATPSSTQKAYVTPVEDF